MYIRSASVMKVCNMSDSKFYSYCVILNNNKNVNCLLIFYNAML